MKTSILFLFVLLCGISVKAQHTFSIVAVDPETGEVGSAGASCIAGSIIISGMVPGIGAVHSQASVCIPNYNLENGLRWMEDGLNSFTILDSLKKRDACGSGDSKNRQYGITQFGDDFTGDVKGYTGVNTLDWKGHKTGTYYSIQGNILIGPEVLDSMEANFLNSAGQPLCDRLMAALQGANIAGADKRCLNDSISSLSAFIRMAVPGDTTGSYCLDINVNDSPNKTEPIDSVQYLYNQWRTNCPSVVANFTQSKDTVNIGANEYLELIDASINEKFTGWNMGDGQRSWETNPSYLYTDTGLYQITLVAGAMYCSDTASSEVYAYIDCSKGDFDIVADIETLSVDAGLVAFHIDTTTSSYSNYDWDFQDGSGLLASGTSANHEFMNVGIYHVEVLAWNDHCQKTKTIAIVVNGPSGLDDEGHSHQLNIQPNPNNGRFKIVGNYHLDSKVKIYTIEGKELISNYINSGSSITIDMDELGSGLYMLHLVGRTGLTIATTKIIVK